MTQTATANVEEHTVTLGDTIYKIQPLANADTFTVLVEGVPVGRIVYTFGAANGVPESDSSVSEDTLTVVAEAWFAATE